MAVAVEAAIPSKELPSAVLTGAGVNVGRLVCGRGAGTNVLFEEALLLAVLLDAG